MPHLTPMNWLLAMITVWVLITLMNINQWSTTPMKFTNMNKKSKSNTKTNWTWS